MTFFSRLTPNDPFPEHLETLSDDDLEILNSRLHRQAEYEYRQEGEAELETRFRLEFLAEELDHRDSRASEAAQGTSESLRSESARSTGRDEAESETPSESTRMANA